MKRIISIALSLIMLISMFSMTVTADTNSIEYDDAENFAFNLGITDKASYNPNAYLTRAEFCQLVYNLLTAGDDSEEKDAWLEDNFGEDTKDEVVVLGDTKIFDDVDIAVPQYDAIKYMVENGFVNGMTENNFGPGYNITVAAAAKVMINILGYDFMARDNGGFPNGYIYTANRIKLLSGIDAGTNDFITMQECLYIFYNALDVKLFDLDYIDGDGDVYLTRGKDSFLTAGLGFVRMEGTVSDTGITTVYGASKVGESKAVIDGVTVEVGSCTDIRSLIGREVSAYCHYNKDKNKYTLRHIQTMDDKTVTFDAQDFISFASEKITYADERGNIKTANTVSKSKLKVVYNGKAISSWKDSIFSFPFGDITLIATTGNTYDLAVIRDYDVGMVSKVRASDMYVYSETLYKDMDAVKYLNLDPDDVTVTIKNAYGEIMDAAQIAKGNVISAMVSPDGNYVEAVVSASAVSGFVVDTVSEGASDILYTNGENEYALSSKDKLIKNPVVKIGKAHNLYLDHKGRLVYIELAGEDTSGEKAGFITGVENFETAFDTDRKIRLYTEEGLMAIYDFDERIIFNGDTRKTKDVIDEIEKAFKAQKAVLYSADTKTKVIKSITLPLEFGADDPYNRGWYHISPDGARLSLYEGEKEDSTEYADNKSTYGMKWAVNGYAFGRVMFWDKALTKTMKVPSYVTQYSDEKNFMVSSGSAPFGSTDEKFLIHGYSRNSKAMAPDLLVYASAAQGAEKVTTTSFFVVEKLANGLDSDGDSVTQLTGWEVTLTSSSCKKVSYTVDENTYFAQWVPQGNEYVLGIIDPDNYDIKTDGPAKVEDLGAGDILRFSKTSDGVLRSIYVNYDESQNLCLVRRTPSASIPFDGEITMSLGYPLYVTGTYIRMVSTKYLPEDMEQNSANLLDPSKLMAFKAGTRAVIVVENQGRKTVVRQGTINDIVTYEDTGVNSKYERVAGVLYGGETIGTVVYKVTE